MSQRGFKYNSSIDTIQFNFCIYQSTIHWKTCELCNQKVLTDLYSKKKCHTCNIFRKGTEYNPGVVPDCLKILTYVERQLIARIHPVVSLYKIQNCQYGYKGNIINFPQNVQEIADILPHKIEDLNNIITIRLDNSNSHQDFQVRRSEVHNALLWLKKNNPFYKDIEISEANLKLLPENKNMYRNMKGYNVNQNIPDSFDSECESSSNESDFEDMYSQTRDDEELGIVVTDIPNITDYSQTEKIENSLAKNIHPFPTIGKYPINEFESPGYFTNAFPTLFPHGLGDITTFDSQRKVKMTDYVKYLMNFEDGRFAKDERFRYFLIRVGRKSQNKKAYGFVCS
ncbi:uncharacterized protein LOC117644209 [Thrips palmi]|uniref:Uncharacterized protein LOC117644209 n=1 Tax=Thrips palmi TaxID=161013 RepID=A0A6P8YQX3_THRPL|nr:uncharacterized protein LOC117644209 [Thrips palmi]